MPNEAPICWKILTALVARGIASVRSPRYATVIAGTNTAPSPAPRITSAAPSASSLVPWPTKA